jgi:two-component system sensor histidine kinase UhpB
VNIKRKNQEIHINIKDNGTGIREKDLFSENNFGLTVMRERATLLGGALKIKGKPGSGTTVKLSIPLKTVMS